MIFFLGLLLLIDLSFFDQISLSCIKFFDFHLPLRVCSNALYIINDDSSFTMIIMLGVCVVNIIIQLSVDVDAEF